jgi:formylglycine-generating enzyme required for sulfatase activity
MSNTATQTNQAPAHPHSVPAARRQGQLFAAAARWLTLALLAGFTLAAQAQRTATATALVMSGFVVDITMTDGGAGYFFPPLVKITGGSGSGATAEATVTNGAVIRINVLTTGSGYTSTPSVVVAPPPLAIQIAPKLVVDGEPGSTAKVSYAESTMPTQWTDITNVVLATNGFTWCDPVARPGQRRYQAVSVPPNPSQNPRTAAGTPVVYNSFVIGVAVTDGGAGYLSSPSVTFGGSGSGATAEATINNGVVANVTVKTTGSGYTSASVVFSAPPRVTKLTEYQVPKVTVRWEPATDVMLQSSEALDGTNCWTDRNALVASSNAVIWFDLTATQAMSRFFRVVSDMAFIPAGSFTMGDTFSEGYSGELPLHSVYVSAFFLDKYDVTKARWDEVCTWANTHGYQFGQPGAGKAANHPVHTVSWYDVVKWCNARSEKAGLVPAYYTSAAQTTPYRTGSVAVQNGWVKWSSGYRLPTEAEWEKAARGGASGQRFPWGNTISWTNANYAANPGTHAYDVNPTSGYNPIFQEGTSPVGYFPPNGYGLYDMSGNCWKWCWDWSTTYSSDSQTDPRGDPSGPSRRTCRGSRWNDQAVGCRTSNRSGCIPGEARNDVGFRSVLPPGSEQRNSQSGASDDPQPTPTKTAPRSGLQ